MERRPILMTILLLCFFINLNSQENILEERALVFFCENISQIKEGIIDYNIKFSGRIMGKSSDVFDIADCLGDISLIENNIPDIDGLDSLSTVNKKLIISSKHLKYDCGFLRKFCVNKKSYTLRVFEAIEYKNSYYVELYLVNKRRSSWVICIKLDMVKKEPIDYCIKYIAF